MQVESTRRSGDSVDVGDGDAFGRAEGFDVGVLRELNGALHERRPDGCGGVGSLNLDVGVVVVADPDDTKQVGGVAGEPGIVLGAGLTGGRRGEALRAHAGTGAVVDHAFHERLGEVGDARIEDLLGFGREVGDDVAVGVADGGEHPGSEVDAVVGEDGVGAGYVERCSVIGSDGHRWGAAGI